jgi:hypothetical protein
VTDHRFVSTCDRLPLKFAGDRMQAAGNTMRPEKE